ncbi:MAG: CAP domain-containing protein [Desulfobacteraceae bacterium]|nr:CAP domain-containing protein [Desulfobacteraceae bacterium]
MINHRNHKIPFFSLQNIVKRTVIITLLFMTCITLTAYANETSPLFTDTDYEGQLREINPNIVLRERIVTIDFNQLAFDGAEDTINLNFFDDTVFEATKACSKYKNSPNGEKLKWTGTIAGESDGIIHLERKDEKVAIIAKTNDLRYDVRHVEGNVHVVQEVDLNELRAVAGDERFRRYRSCCNQETVTRNCNTPNPCAQCSCARSCVTVVICCNPDDNADNEDIDNPDDIADDEDNGNPDDIADDEVNDNPDTIEGSTPETVTGDECNTPNPCDESCATTDPCAESCATDPCAESCATDPCAESCATTDPCTESDTTTTSDTESDTTTTSDAESGENSGMTDMAYEVFTLVNQERAKVNLPELSEDDALTQVAQNWTQEMVDMNDLTHNTDTLEDMQAAGYEGNSSGENIAWGEQTESGSANATPESVMNGWMNSQGHKENILGDFTDLGVGFIEADSGFWWTQVFGGV